MWAVKQLNRLKRHLWWPRAARAKGSCKSKLNAIPSPDHVPFIHLARCLRTLRARLLRFSGTSGGRAWRAQWALIRVIPFTDTPYHARMSRRAQHMIFASMLPYIMSYVREANKWTTCWIKALRFTISGEHHTMHHCRSLKDKKLEDKSSTFSNI